MDFQKALPGYVTDERGDSYIAYKDGSRELLPIFTAEEAKDARCQAEEQAKLLKELRELDGEDEK
jgi:hypothetical protein